MGLNIFKKIGIVIVGLITVYLVIFFVIYIKNKGDLRVPVESKADINFSGDLFTSLAGNKINGQINNTNNINNIEIKKDVKGVEYNKNYTSPFSPKFGNPDAKIHVIMFFDFDCPFCRDEYKNMVIIMQKYKDKGYFEFRNMPFITLHPNAKNLANVGMCANNQGKFWEMFDQLFMGFDKRANVSSDEEFSSIYLSSAGNIGLDMNKFSKCLSSKQFESIVNKDIVDGAGFGVVGTPTFFINGNKTEGVIDLATWDKIFK